MNIDNKLNVKSARERLGVTQQQAADALNLSRTTYLKYENGTHNVPTDVLHMMTQYFNASSDYLLGFSDVPETVNGYAPEICARIARRVKELLKEKPLGLDSGFLIPRDVLYQMSSVDYVFNSSHVTQLSKYFGVDKSELLGETDEIDKTVSRLSPAEHSLILAYRKASADDRAIIDNIVARYTHAAEVKHA